MAKNKSKALGLKKPRIHPAALAAFAKPASPKPTPSPCPSCQSSSTEAYLEAYYGCACEWGRC